MQHHGPNPYVPYEAELTMVRPEGPGLMTFEASLLDPQIREKFTYLPGQFLEVSIYGKGEAPFGIASAAAPGRPVRFSVQNMGRVSQALHGLAAGDRIGIRGPFGNGFPMLEHRGRNLVIVAGGIGLPPLRSVVEYVLEHREDYGAMQVIYGARNPGMLTYKDKLEEWATRDDMQLNLTVDKGDETWTGHEGFVPQYLEELSPSPADAVLYTVGPPIMIHFVLLTLARLGWPPEQVFASLEAKMKCGFGKCGRCNVGPKFVCLDGPVFSQAELATLTE
jgi:NAD(P)H-flavin reductase